MKRDIVDEEVDVHIAEPQTLEYTTKSGRRTTRMRSYNESSDKETDLFDQPDNEVEIMPRRGRNALVLCC